MEMNLDGSGGASGGSSSQSQYSRSDSFWEGMTAIWKREVGAFFDQLIASFKIRDKAIISKGVKWHGIDINAKDD
jgi:hypothetical protein